MLQNALDVSLRRNNEFLPHLEANTWGNLKRVRGASADLAHRY